MRDETVADVDLDETEDGVLDLMDEEEKPRAANKSVAEREFEARRRVEDRLEEMRLKRMTDDFDFDLDD